jgi:hypothetical protein
MKTGNTVGRKLGLMLMTIAPLLTGRKAEPTVRTGERVGHHLSAIQRLHRSGIAADQPRDCRDLLCGELDRCRHDDPAHGFG